jgi:hypothetical protein
VKKERSDWNKRQATLQLCLHANGLLHTKPLLMFKGLLGTGDVRRRREMKRYPKGICVIFNDNAYVNKDNLKQWAC